MPAVGSPCWADPSSLGGASSSAPGPAPWGRTLITPTPATRPCRAGLCSTGAVKRQTRSSSHCAAPLSSHQRAPSSPQSLGKIADILLGKAEVLEYIVWACYIGHVLVFICQVHSHRWVMVMFDTDFLFLSPFFSFCISGVHCSTQLPNGVPPLNGHPNPTGSYSPLPHCHSANGWGPPWPGDQSHSKIGRAHV